MKKIVMEVVLAVAAVAAAQELSFRRPPIVPAPASLTWDERLAVPLSERTPFEVTCPDVSTGAMVRRFVREWFGYAPRVELKASAPSGINGDEGYGVSAKPDRIAIRANTSRGVRYALYTLRQSSERVAQGVKLTGYVVPSMEIVDAPSLSFRGVHFCWFPEQDAKLIEHQIRLAAYYKFNYVVLEPWGVFKSRQFPQLSIRDAPLTIKEAKRLSALAGDLGVTLIPQLNIFGHATAARSMSGKHIALDFHPELQPLFEPAGGWNWCLSNPDAVATVRSLVAEMHEAFGNPPFFHIGCDEADEPSCARCRAVKPYAKLVGEHIAGVRNLLHSRGARAMMWHDMLLEKGDKKWRPFYANGTPEEAALAASLPRDIVICDWYYGANYGRESKPEKFVTIEHFKSLGYNVVTCPWNDLKGIDVQGGVAREMGLFGLLETTWHHFRGPEFAKMMETSAHAAWGGGEKSVGEWTAPFATHWRQIGWDMRLDSYPATGYYDSQVTRSPLDR